MIKEKANVNVQLISIVSSTTLGAVHDCVARVGPVEPYSFTWPELEAEDEVVFNDLVKLQEGFHPLIFEMVFIPQVLYKICIKLDVYENKP